MTENILEILGVTKQYSGTTAVRNVSLSIPSGCIYGLLGPNGAGKTSLIRMITTITQPDSGEIRFKGKPLSDSDNENMGYMPEERGMYRKMKVREQLEYFLRLKGKNAREAREITKTWMKKLDILSWSEKKVGDLSKGMQQKVQFAGTIAHDPELIILDEPFSGLDPINSKLIEDQILELKKSGKTILFSTHRMEQVEEFCDKIALINRGGLVLEGDVNQIRRQYRQEKYLVDFDGEGSSIMALEGVTCELLSEGKVRITPLAGQSGKKLMQQLSSLPVEIVKFELPLPRLSEIFIEAVRKSEKETVHA